MQPIIVLIVLGLVVCSTASLSVCPADLDEQVKREDAAVENDIAVDQKRDDFALGDETMPMVTQVCGKFGFSAVLEYMSQKPIAAEPAFDVYLKQQCRESRYCLTKVWHGGEMCHIIFPHWQRVCTVKCYYERCCDENVMKTCRPSAYRHYHILVYCPESQTCKLIHRSYPTRCSCRWWWCLRSSA